MEFHKKLVYLRNAHHMTQSQLAEALGVSRQSVYKWETGASYPEAMTLWQMHQLFDISLDILLDPQATIGQGEAMTEGEEQVETPAKPKKKPGKKKEKVVQDNTTEEKKKGILSRLFGK